MVITAQLLLRFHMTGGNYLSDHSFSVSQQAAQISEYVNTSCVFNLLSSTQNMLPHQQPGSLAVYACLDACEKADFLV